MVEDREDAEAAAVQLFAESRLLTKRLRSWRPPSADWAPVDQYDPSFQGVVSDMWELLWRIEDAIEDAPEASARDLAGHRDTLIDMLVRFHIDRAVPLCGYVGEEVTARFMKAFREGAGITQRGMADILGTNTPQVTNYEGQKHNRRMTIAQMTTWLKQAGWHLSIKLHPLDSPHPPFGVVSHEDSIANDGLAPAASAPETIQGEIFAPSQAARAGSTPVQPARHELTRIERQADDLAEDLREVYLHGDESVRQILDALAFGARGIRRR